MTKDEAKKTALEMARELSKQRTICFVAEHEEGYTVTLNHPRLYDAVCVAKFRSGERVENMP